jgi:hypothetical protein
VEYCNTPNDGRNPNGGTNWAAKRAADGYPAPFGVRYWEVGNEVYGSWESGYDPVGTTYAKNFNVIADAMKAVDPTIAIGLVVHVDKKDQPWTKTVLSHPGTADRADFLIVHDYFAFPRTAADLAATNWMAKATQVGERKAWLDALVAANTRRAPGSLPYYLGEYNIGIGNLPPQLSLTSGLFISKVLGELTRTGWAAASLWDITHGYAASPLGGHGSHGFLSADQPGVPDLTPRPSYYAFYFFTRNFGDRMVKASSSDPSLQIYASTWSNGKVGAVLVNEATQAKKIRFAFADGFRPSGPANVWVLSAPSLNSEAVKLNGIGNGLVSGGPPPENVKPYALNPTDGSVSLDVPANSVASIVVY